MGPVEGQFTKRERPTMKVIPSRPNNPPGIGRVIGEGVKKNCPKCGRTHGESRICCPANGKQCGQFQLYDHFGGVLPQGLNKIEEKWTQIKGSDRHQRRSERDREEEEYNSSLSEDEHLDRRIMGVKASARDPKRNRLVTINGHDVSFLIDSGADVSCLDKDITRRVGLLKELGKSRIPMEL